MQHLSEPLQKALLREVERESDKEWALKATIPAPPKFIPNKAKIPLSAGLWYLLRQLNP
jgi:hypothetical protein